MIGRVIAVSSLVAAVILGGVLEVTTPSTIGPLGILIVFILMYIVVLGALTFTLYGLSYALSRAARVFVARHPVVPLTVRKSYYFATVLALAPIMIMGMQSVGGVSVYDFLLVFFFTMIAVIYISKRAS